MRIPGWLDGRAKARSGSLDTVGTNDRSGRRLCLRKKYTFVSRNLPPENKIALTGKRGACILSLGKSYAERRAEYDGLREGRGLDDSGSL